MANQQKYASYLLADELRQSSDDLTRLGRTYIITQDPAYKKQYLNILDIRNGKKPRPENYHRIYWDFVAAGIQQTSKYTATISLLELMRKNEFTKKEFEKLNQAKKNSDGLVSLEVEAMNLIEGKDIKGNPTATINLAKARNLVHSKKYHKFKADIMTPIDEFYVLMEQRTNNRVMTAQNSGRMYQNLTFVGTFSLIITMFAMVCFIYLRVIKSLGLMKLSMSNIVDNKLNEKDTILSARNDEIGDMDKAIGIFRENAKDNIELKEKQEKQRNIANKEAQSMREQMASDFETAVGRVVEAVTSAATEVQISAKALFATSEETSQQSSVVAIAAEEASTNIQTVSSAAEELSSSISEINRQVHESTQIAEDAVRNVEATNERVHGLTKASEKIEAVISIITEIAEQTNLLALNATIEAARAGEAEKGFAVVASEVKELASQTAKATEEISSQIKDIQDSTNGTVSAIASIGDTIQRIRENSNAIASAVEEQGAATQEIARNIEQVSNGTIQVTSNITGVNQAASETGHSSQKLLTAANELSQQSEFLSSEVGTFLQKVRAG